MKKITLIFSICLLAFAASAQRFGTTPNADNTGRILTYSFSSKSDATGADTIKLNPNAWETLVIPVSVQKDSVVYTTTTARSFSGDQLIFQFTNSSGSGHYVKFSGSNWQFSSSGSKISLTSSKRANIVFQYDGVAWVELSRMVQ